MLVLYFLDIPNYVSEALIDGATSHKLNPPSIIFHAIKTADQANARNAKKADTALQKNEKLLRNLLEIMPVGVWVIDLKKGISSREIGRVRKSGAALATSVWTSITNTRAGG